MITGAGHGLKTGTGTLAVGKVGQPQPIGDGISAGAMKMAADAEAVALEQSVTATFTNRCSLNHRRLRDVRAHTDPAAAPAKVGAAYPATEVGRVLLIVLILIPGPHTAKRHPRVNGSSAEVELARTVVRPAVSQVSFAALMTAHKWDPDGYIGPWRWPGAGQDCTGATITPERAQTGGFVEAIYRPQPAPPSGIPAWWRTMSC